MNKHKCCIFKLRKKTRKVIIAIRRRSRRSSSCQLESTFLYESEYFFGHRSLDHDRNQNNIFKKKCVLQVRGLESLRLKIFWFDQRSTMLMLLFDIVQDVQTTLSNRQSGESHKIFRMIMKLTLVNLEPASGHCLLARQSNDVELIALSR